MVAYDPMTELTLDQMNELVGWWLAAETDEIELKNQTCSGGVLRVTIEDGSVWITPAP